ncbi:MAG: N-6 DNA methylase [Polyangiaceae bacterium]|nr:N-6 DNA methylase [Polyangiaceae bacterium]
MAVKRKIKTRESQLAFEALAIEGALLSPEWLSKVAQLQAGIQTEADYRVPKGLNLRDEIGRYWRIAQAHWSDFKSGREAQADAKATAQRFVLTLLREAFGFTSLAPVEPAVVQERAYPIGHAALDGRAPVVVAPADSGLDTLSPMFGDGARRRSAFGLAQEYLNAQDGALWGIASDGASLRIVRDNASLTRPAWVEADLQRIFTEERYADFAALWLLCHETRFGREGQAVTDCALEVWRNAGREEGTRAREHLRRGVEEALIALGQGFLAHADNTTLRADLQNGTLSVKDYFNQLLRLIYRLIFLLTVEERALLHPDGASDATRALYANGYGIRRLRERSVKRSAHDRFADLWDATKVVCRGLAAGEPRLGLPALAGIFAANQCPALDVAKLENRALLLAVFKLAWLRENGSLARVNWRDMGPEELGSVYESLLELVPQITSGRQFAFATGNQTKGNARKTTGSYYTPDSLVQVLLDSALEPVIADTIAKNPGNPVEALLGLSIVDPSCGSGHFLLAAASRLAAHVARLKANGTPSAAEYRHALRQVVGHCIFGVDLNPMAVELCKVALWMEAVEPGLPLTFLNSHIQHGNALLGTTPELMANGIPDAAWNPIEGDDKKVASGLKKRNKAEAGGQQTFDFSTPSEGGAEAQAVTRAITELDAASDTDATLLAKKEERWDGIRSSPEYLHQKLVADTWCAAFVWPKQLGELADAAPTNGVWRQLCDGQGIALTLTTKTVEELTAQHSFFHWHLQFPQVFAKGGFDIVLGNPPWDLLEDKVGNLPTRKHNAEQQFYRQGIYEVLSGRRDLYKLFLVVAPRLLKSTGRMGFLTPVGAFIEDDSYELRKFLFEDNSVAVLRHFQNRRKSFFSHVDARYRICLLVCSRALGLSHTFSTSADNPASIPRQYHITLEPAAISRVLGDGYSAVIYDDERYARLHSKVLASCSSAEKIRYRVVAEFHSSADKELISKTPAPSSWIVLKNRNIHHFNHRFAAPEAWIAIDSVRERLPRKGLEDPPWASDMVRLVFRDIARSDDERTLIACLAPPGNVSSYDTPMLVPECAAEELPLRLLWMAAAASSFVVDFLIRPFVDKHVKPYTIARVPWLDVPPEARLALPLLLGIVTELVFDDDRFTPFFMGIGCDRPRATAALERVFLLRCELDASLFHVYGLSRDDVAYVMETFPIVKRKDEAAFGEYRTKRVILEVYDAMADAARTGTPYQTRLNPLPTSPRVAQPSREDGKILPFRPAVRPQPAIQPVVVLPASHRNLPAWSPDLLPAVATKTGLAASAGRWGTTLTGVALGIAALAAVLRNIGGPALRDEVERAVVLSVLPRFLQSKFDAQTAQTWRHAIGAANMHPSSITALSIPWAEVLRRATVEHLLVLDADGRWRAGADINDAPSEVLDVRALVSLAWIENVSSAVVEDTELLTQMEVLRAA